MSIQTQNILLYLLFIIFVIIITLLLVKDIFVSKVLIPNILKPSYTIDSTSDRKRGAISPSRDSALIEDKFLFKFANIYITIYQKGKQLQNTDVNIVDIFQNSEYALLIHGNGAVADIAMDITAKTICNDVSETYCISPQFPTHGISDSNNSKDLDRSLGILESRYFVDILTNISNIDKSDLSGKKLKIYATSMGARTVINGLNLISQPEFISLYKVTSRFIENISLYLEAPLIDTSHGFKNRVNPTLVDILQSGVDSWDIANIHTLLNSYKFKDMSIYDLDKWKNSEMNMLRKLDKIVVIMSKTDTSLSYDYVKNWSQDLISRGIKLNWVSDDKFVFAHAQLAVDLGPNFFLDNFWLK